MRKYLKIEIVGIPSNSQRREKESDIFNFYITFNVSAW